MPILNFTEMIAYDELSMWLKNKKIPVNGQGLKVCMLILNLSLLFYCFLCCFQWRRPGAEYGGTEKNFADQDF